MNLLELKIEPVYKKAFIITFLISVIVFFTIISNLFWGNHDWENIQKSIILNESLYECRFAATILQTIFCLKLIPYIIYLSDITILIISLFMIADYWNVPKKVSNLVIFSLFWILMPSTLSILYYQALSLGIICSVFFSILSLKLCLKINNKKNKCLKILYFLLSIIFLYVFVLGTYPVALNIILVLIMGKLLIEFKNSNFQLIIFKEFFKKYKFFICNILISLIFIISTFYILKYFNILNENFYTIKLTYIDMIFNRLLFVNKLFFNSLISCDPFIGIYSKILLLFILGFVLFIFLRQLKNTNYSVKNKIIKFLTVFILFYLLFLGSLLSFLISSGLNEITPRVLHFGFDFVFLFCISIILNETNLKIKNICVIIIFLFIYNSAINNMYAQKVEYLSFKNELLLQNRLFMRITNDKNFDINKKYLYCQIGQYENFNKRFYIGNYGNVKNDELLYILFVSPDSPSSGLKYLADKDFIFDGDFYSYDIDDNFDEQMYDELYDFIMNKAKVYPSKDSIFISEHYILVVFDKLYLDFLKTKLSKRFNYK